MFGRAKLMLADAPEAAAVTARVHLTDERGLPRCARLRPPAVEWRPDTDAAPSVTSGP